MKELRLLATPAALTEVNAFVEGELEACGASPKAFMQIMVALEELYVNIAHYAYAPGHGDAVVSIRLDEADRTVYICLTDWGKPFDPLAKADPDVTLSAEERDIGGLGIYMVKKSMDVFTYERTGDQNIVTIGKKLQ